VSPKLSLRRHVLAQRIREARLRRNLTYIALARLIGVTERTIYRYESGELTPDFERIEQLASALEVSFGWLIGASRRREVSSMTTPIRVLLSLTEHIDIEPHAVAGEFAVHRPTLHITHAHIPAVAERRERLFAQLIEQNQLPGSSPDLAGWTVSHLPSGLLVLHCETRAAACAALAALAPLTGIAQCFGAKCSAAETRRIQAALDPLGMVVAGKWQRLYLSTEARP